MEKGKNKILLSLILFGWIICGLIFVGALEFDNVKSISKSAQDKYGKVTITNAFGLGSKLVDIQLLNNSDYCLINCYAEGTITFYSPGKLMDGLRFEKLITKDTYNSNYKIFLKTGEKTEDQEYIDWNCVTTGYDDKLKKDIQNCTKEIKIRQVVSSTYSEYDNSEMPAGTYTWRIEGKKKMGESIDWIANWKGIDVTEWAIWSSSFNTGLVRYWNMSSVIEQKRNGLSNLDTGSFVAYNAPPANCKIGQCANNSAVNMETIDSNITYNFKNVTTEATKSINMWVYSIAGDRHMLWASGSSSYLYHRADTSIEVWSFTGNIVTGSMSFNAWHMMTVTIDATGKTNFYLDGVYANQVGSFGASTSVGTLEIGQRSGTGHMEGYIDEVGMWNRTLSVGEITDLYNGGVGLSPDMDVINLISPIDNYASSLALTPLSCEILYPSGLTLNFTLWTNYTGVWIENLTNVTMGGANSTTFLRNNIGTTGWTCSMCKTDGSCIYPKTNKTVREAGSLRINVTTQSQTFNLGRLNTGFTLNWTSTGGDACRYQYNNINVSVACMNNGTIINHTSFNNRNLILWINTTEGRLNSTTYQWNYFIFQNNISYNPTTYQTASENFTININYNSSLFNIFALLNYDNITYSSTRLGVGDNVVFNNLINIPSSTTSPSTFKFEFTLVNASTSLYINTTNYSQTINPILFGICNASMNVVFVNFTLRDEQSNAYINSSFSATFNILDTNNNILSNYSYFNNTDASYYYDFCAVPVSSSIRVNMDSLYTKNGYDTRSYYLTQATLNNLTSNVELLLLNTSYAQKFYITVQEALTPLVGVYVTTTRYDISTGTWKTISIRQTDSSGEFIEYLLLDNDYRFFIFSNSTLRGVVDKTSICSSAPCELTLELTANSSGVWDIYDSIYASGVAYNLSYNPTTKLVTYEFVDLTGLANYFTLTVIRKDWRNSSQGVVCNVSLFNTVGVLRCNATNYGDGDFMAYGYVSRSPSKLVGFISFVIRAFRDIIGQEGLLFAFILIILAGLIGFWSPPAGIILACVVFFLSTVIGILSVSIVSVVMICVLGILMAIKMGKTV